MSDDDEYVETPSRVAANSSRRRAAVVELPLGRSPISSAMRHTHGGDFGLTDHETVPNIWGRRTETLFSDLFEDGVAPGSGGTKIRVAGASGEQVGDKDEDMRFDRLLARLKAVQGGMNEHSEHTSPENALLAKHHHADNSSFSYPPESSRNPTRDIPLRFHAGRESLSVKKNITVRDSKRPKERSLDRAYKQ